MTFPLLPDNDHTNVAVRFGELRRIAHAYRDVHVARSVRTGAAEGE